MRRAKHGYTHSEKMNMPQKLGFNSERRALLSSMLLGITLAAVGIAVGVLTKSQIILFDGFYTFLGIGLSALAIRVSKLVDSGPTSRYPFGREALTPMIIGVEAVALLATCLYASANAVLSILAGGEPVPGVYADLYATLAVILPLALWGALRSLSRRSELVHAETIQWLAGAVLGLGMLAAFTLASSLTHSHLAYLAPYIDPSLVIIASIIFLFPPLAMLRSTFLELVEGRPPAPMRALAVTATEMVKQTFGLGVYHLRTTKLGRKLYVEVDFVVEPSWTVRDSDLVRQALNAALTDSDLDAWLTVEFTSDPSWGT